MQTDALTSSLPPGQSMRHCADKLASRLHGGGKSVYAHSLSNLISSNKQRWHRSNICHHGPSVVRWDGKQELNLLWCCRSKRVTRAILSRTSAFSLLDCNSIPVLNWVLRLHRPNVLIIKLNKLAWNIREVFRPPLDQLNMKIGHTHRQCLRWSPNL